MNLLKKPVVKRPLLLVAITVIVLAIAAGGFVFLRHPQKPAAPAVAPSPAEKIKYEPATKEEKQQAEDTKDAIAESRNKAPAPTTPDGRKAVTPIISLANYQGAEAAVQGFVPGIFEDGGACTATLTNGNQTVTVQSAAFANATTTDCQHISIPRSKFPVSGTWIVNLAYASATAKGTSSGNTTIEIP